MSTLTVADVSLEAGGPRPRCAGWRPPCGCVSTGGGVHRTLSNQQKEEVSAAYAADTRLYSPLARRSSMCAHEAFRKLTLPSARRIISYWRGLTFLPYTEPGVRLDPAVRRGSVRPHPPGFLAEEVDPGRGGTQRRLPSGQAGRPAPAGAPCSMPPTTRPNCVASSWWSGTSRRWNRAQLLAATQPGSLPGRSGAGSRAASRRPYGWPRRRSWPSSPSWSRT